MAVGRIAQAEKRLQDAQDALGDLQAQIGQAWAKLRELREQPVSAEVEVAIIGQERLIERLRERVGPAQRGIDALQLELDNVLAERKRLAQNLEKTEARFAPLAQAADLRRELEGPMTEMAEKLAGTPYRNAEAALLDALNRLRQDNRMQAILEGRLKNFR